MLVEGPFLTHPSLRPRLERVIHLDAPEDLRLRRFAAREGSPEALEWMRREVLGAERAFDRQCGGAAGADLLLDASNPLGSAP